jgi:hypothetical protein
MSTIKTTNLQNASAASPAFVLAADGTATANLSSLNGGPIAGSRNRIINGDMRIDQRNAGASVTPTDSSYTLDRWKCRLSQSSKYTVQRNAGSVTPPTGFSNYLGVTSSSAYSVLAGDYFAVQQIIEGFNFSDFGYGTANAATLTLSFWVRSSLTGTFGGALQNSAEDRSYGFTYAISAANTWERKTLTITGDTSGTWLGSTSGIGLYVNFNLGTGSTYGAATNGAWASGATAFTPTGATSVVGTNGATFYITGVQLEPGTVATPFERRSYGAELALCQRYFWTSYQTGTAVGSAAMSGYIIFTRWNDGGNFSYNTIQNPVSMRTGPTVTGYSTGGTSGVWIDNASINRTFGLVQAGTMAFTVTSTGSGAGTTGQIYGHVAATAEL